METIESNYQEECSVFVNDNDSINQIGCSFFVEALNSPRTYISSNQLRWFTYQFRDADKKKTQDEAKRKIENEANQRDKSHNIDMNIMLYSNPTELKDDKITEYIKYLLQCSGVDIRYFETKEDQNLRVSISGTKLFLSMSKEQEEQVHEGILYIAKDKDSPLLVYFTERFKQDFNRAKKVILDNKERIVFADNWKERLRVWLKSDRGINVISLWIGIVGAIMTILASVIAIFGCFRGH